VKGDGTRHATYYALRLANRALKGAKPTFRVNLQAPDVMAIATKDPDGKLNLLVLNWSENVSYQVHADLSGLLTTGEGTIREFSAKVRDETTGRTGVAEGISRFALPAQSVVLVQYAGGG